MKTTKKILSMLLAIAVITLLAACASDTPAGSTTGSNGGEGNNLGINAVDPIDGEDTFIDQNPDTDPPIDSPDGSEVDTFDEVETATIENAVVVGATKYNDPIMISFSCAAVIQGYGNEYTPFTFSVPMSEIEGEYDSEKLEELTGAIVNIDFDGLFMETFPLQIGEVNKVSITGERADVETIIECEEAFAIEEPEPSGIPEMLICEGWIVKAESASDGSGNAVIYAMAQLGTCGVKDYVKLGFPAEKIRNEAGEAVDIESIAPGTCFEFAYDGSMTSPAEGKAIFEINWTDMDYVTIGTENVGYTAEQYAEYEAYFEIEK